MKMLSFFIRVFPVQCLPRLLGREWLTRNSLTILMIVLLLSNFCLPTQALGEKDVDQRKIDQLILLDISGSVVEDIRAALLKQRLATGQANGYQFRISGGSIEAALASPRVRAVVTNNLLYKAILYTEAIIDQPGAKTIFLATFDDGPRILGNAKLPVVGNNFVGPFSISDADDDVNSPERKKIKSFLAPERWGIFEGISNWHGVLAEAVLKGSGPTAIHGTCLASLDLLKSLVTAGYTNNTKLQRMILFTDGLEGKDTSIPFTKTIDFFKLHRNEMAFEFQKYFILPAGEQVPLVIAEENGKLIEEKIGRIETFAPQTLTVFSKHDGLGLTGKLESPENANSDIAQTIILSSDVHFQVSASDTKPVRGRLKFVVNQIGDLNAELTPSELTTDQLDRPITFSLKIRGSYLDSLFEKDAKSLNGLFLTWQFFGAPSGNPPIYRIDEPSLAFSGSKRLPISVEIATRLRSLGLRCIDPVGVDLTSGKIIEFLSLPRKGRIARFEVDFSKIQEAASVLVQLDSFKQGAGIKLNSGSGGKMLLVKDRSSNEKKEFSLETDMPPGTSSTLLSLSIIPQSRSLLISPTNIQIKASFEPSIVKAEWLGQSGEPTNQPVQIDLGTVYMQSIEGGLAKALDKPPIDLFSLEIPENAVSPALECRLAGTNPEAFCLVVKGDAEDIDPSKIAKSVRIQVQARHVFVPANQSLATNFVATLEIRPKANFIFETQIADERSALRTNLIVIPLTMKAMIQTTERNKPK